MSPQFEELKEKIENKKVRLCIIGLGQVGLPTALSFANSGFSVTGVDINEELVSKINNGFPPFEVEFLQEFIKNKNDYLDTLRNSVLEWENQNETDSNGHPIVYGA